MLYKGRIQNEDTTLFLKMLFLSLPGGKVGNIAQESQMPGHISNWILSVSFPVSFLLTFLPSFFPPFPWPSFKQIRRNECTYSTQILVRTP